MSGTRVDEGINKSKVLTGARITLYAGDQTTPIGYCTSMQYDINIDLVPIHVVDKFAVQEHVETGYNVSFSLGTFRIPKTEGKPGTGSPIEKGWFPKLQEILNSGTIKIRAFDKSSQQDILVIDEVKFSTRSGSISARDVVTENLTGVGIIAWDETGEQTAI